MALSVLVSKLYTLFSPHNFGQSKSHAKPDINGVEKYNSLAGRGALAGKGTNNY